MSRALYLGKEVESQDRLELDPDLLVTHGVILGMTGSGKTGLALGLLEEMVEAGVPVIAIDPKGDLPNLALLFSDFKSTDYEAWLDPSQAQREGLSLAELAQKTAESWSAGLSSWELDGSHIEKLKSKLDLRIFTPGSKAVRPVDLLGSFHSPEGELPEEETAELASGIATGLLSLVIDQVDPLRDPRHVLLVQLLAQAWQAGKSLSLEDLIGQIVDPPFAKVGVFPVDRFLSPDDRMKLAMQVNTLLASPTFAAWKQGAPLDIKSLLKSEDGKVPVNIFTLAHLSEKERQFFVSRLMNEVLSWSRGLPGSSTLRAFIYFDEVAGYLPPHPHNPASKKPILTLLKQSRAVGVGLCLATQNPVDLDYKALSNIGTWMIGRLQTEQDRDRVRDGLMSASGGLTAQEVEAEFSKIKARTFLLKQAKSDRPTTFHTRWAMSFLRGPITLSELPSLPGQTPQEKPSGKASPPGPGIAPQGKSTPPPMPKGFAQSFLDPRVVFHSKFEGYFEAQQEPARSDGKVFHRPALRALLRLKFDHKQDDFILHQVHNYLAFPLQEGEVISRIKTIALEEEDLLRAPDELALFADLPEHLDQKEEFDRAREDLVAQLYRTLTATRLVNKSVKLYSKPEESAEAFLQRCAEEADKMADLAAAKLRDSLEKKMERVHKQLERAQDKVERLALSEKGKKLEGMWRAGEMLMGLFTKKRRSFGAVLGSSRRALEADNRTKQAEDELDKLQAELLDLQADLEQQLEQLEAEHQALAEKIEEHEIRLKKSDILVEKFEILWVPVSKRLL